MSLGVLAALSAIIGLIGAAAWGVRRWADGRATLHHGEDHANLEAAEAGEAAQEAEDEEFRKRRGGLVDRARDRRKRVP